MIEKYWDGVFPRPDEDGLGTRVAHLSGLNGEEADGTLINPLSNVLITQGTSVGPYSSQHYNQGNALGAMPDQKVREKRLAEGAVSMEMFTKAVSESSADFYRNLVDDLAQCEEEFAKISKLLDEKCGQFAPPSSNIRSALTAAKDIVFAVARDKIAVPQPAAGAAPQAGSAASEKAVAAGPGVGALATREDAFEILRKVAEFFRSTEPHTPLSYALEQVVRWGKMSLPELLAELIPDESPRKQFFRQVGIKPPEPEKK